VNRRKWDAQTKVQVVIEGLKGRSVAEICKKFEINQSQYYQWRGTFLANAARAFQEEKRSHKQVRLETENTRLKELVGELTLHLNRADAH
jgi:transposase-like protein